MQYLQQVLPAELPPGGAQAGPHGGAALQVSRMWEVLRTSVASQNAPENPLWGETFPVHVLRQILHAEGRAGGARSSPHEQEAVGLVKPEPETAASEWA